MRGSRNFRQGGGGRHKKSLIMFFLVILVVLHLFYRMPMVYFKENYNFPRSRGASTFFPGGGGGGRGGDPTSFRGIQLLIPYRIPYNLYFSRGSGPLGPPLDQLMLYFDQLDAETKVRYEKKLSILTPPPPLGIPKCIHGVWENNHSGLTRIEIVFPGSDNFGSNPLFFTF